MPFYQGNTEFGHRSPTPRIWIEKEFKIAEPGDVLVSVRAPVGELNVASERCVIGRGLAAVRPTFMYPEFAYCLMQFKQRYLASLGQGSTFDAINSADLRDLPIPLPPLPEQKKIAAILSSVDEAILATQAVIEQTRRVKEGLLQELLTRGIGRGEIVNSEYGPVPRHWNRVRVQDVATVEYGISKAVSQNDDPSIGWPILTGRNITLKGDLDVDRIVYIEPPSNERFWLRENDLLLNWRSGSPAHVGKTARFNLEGKWTYASFVLRIRAKSGLLDPGFGHLLFNYMRANNLFVRDVSVQVNFKMNATVFRDVWLFCPEIDERREIARQVGLINDTLASVQAEADSLQKTKSGLLQDLLTGKKRVTV